MRGLLLPVTVLGVLLLPAVAHAECDPSQSTFATTAGTASASTSADGGSPTTRSDVVLAVSRGASEDYVTPGSTMFTITGPSGSQTKPADRVPDNPETSLKLGKLPAGHYSFSVTWQVRTCNGPDAPTYETGNAGPIAFDVVAPHELPRVFFAGRPGPRGIARTHQSPERATIETGIFCASDEDASTDPITVAIHWQLGTRMPTESSPGASHTYHCPLTSRARPKVTKKSWGSIGFGPSGGGFALFAGRSARILIVVRSGATVVGAIRVRMKPKAGSETAVPDLGPCPSPCAHTWRGR